MIFNPVVSGGGASGGSAWKEVDRSYVAEHAFDDHPANFLVSMFTPDFPDQPMIIPASGVFGIGNRASGNVGECSYGFDSAGEVYKTIYGLTSGGVVGFANDPNADDIFLELHLNDSSGSSDTIPEGWTIKYYIYTPS